VPQRPGAISRASDETRYVKDDFETELINEPLGAEQVQAQEPETRPEALDT